MKIFVGKIQHNFLWVSGQRWVLLNEIPTVSDFLDTVERKNWTNFSTIYIVAQSPFFYFLTSYNFCSGIFVFFFRGPIKKKKRIDDICRRVYPSSMHYCFSVKSVSNVFLLLVLFYMPLRNKISGITATESRIAHIEAGNHEIVFSVVYEPTTTFLGSLTVDIFIKAFEQLSVVPSSVFFCPGRLEECTSFSIIFCFFCFQFWNICSHLSFCGVQTTFDR